MFVNCTSTLSFQLERMSTNIPKQTEEKIDKLERALKISRRKGQHEKVNKITAELDKLRSENAAPAGTSDDKGPMFKTGDGWITFEVEAGWMQSVFVTFTAMAQEGRKVWYGKEEGTATILVYESKNIDITKKIKYTATVCFDQDTLQKSLGTGDEGDLALVSAPTSAPASAPSSTRASPILVEDADGERKPAFLPTSPPSSRDDHLPAFDQVSRLAYPKPKAKLPSKSRSMLEITPQKLDLGEVRVFEEIPSQITLRNLSLTKVPFEIVVVPQKPASSSPSTQSPPATSPTAGRHTTEGKGKAAAVPEPLEPSPPPPPAPAPKNVLFLKQRRGTLDSFGQTVVEFTIHPQTPGKQTHVLLVRNLANGLEDLVSITLSPRPLQYIHFPDLVNAAQLEFGQCYIEKSKKYAKVVPLRMENQSHSSLFVSMRSNLAMQVFIFQDEKLEKPAENIALQGYIFAFLRGFNFNL